VRFWNLDDDMALTGMMTMLSFVYGGSYRFGLVVVLDSWHHALEVM